MDARMYGGVGAVFGFFVVGGLLKFIFASASISDREIYVFSLGGAFAGAFLGRLLLRSKRGSL